jgi:hypothetical protein
MSHYGKYLNKCPYRVPPLGGYEWTIRTLGSMRHCYNMFRMHKDVFDSLHYILLERYGLKPTRKMTFYIGSWDVWWAKVHEAIRK